MFKGLFKQGWRSSVAAGLCVAFAGGASAQSVEEFYKGRQVQVVIYSPAGSTYDLYARFLTQFMGRHLPGNPVFVPRNMVGAGGLQATTYLYRIAPKDGATFGTIARNIPFEPMLGKNDANIDPLAFVWLGSMNKDRSIALSWHTSKVKTLADLQKMELLVPGTGAGADSEVMPIAFNTLFGTKFNIVKGYKSTGDSTLAVERGEIDGIAYWSWSAIQSSHRRWLDDKLVNVLFHTGPQNDPEIKAPSIRSLVRDQTEQAALDFILAREIIGRPFLAPPGIPEDRAKALRDAFNATMRDPDFIAEAKRRNIEIQLVTSDEVNDVLKKAAASPPAVLDRVRKALER
jgi:tripartite-type tricarboxylate transporter receptor subunit TctC